MRFKISVLFLFFFPVLYTGAEAANITGAKIIDYGLYSYEAEATVPPSAHASEVRSERFIKTTNIIEAKRGLTFGFRFILYGAPSGEEVTLQFKGSTPMGADSDRREWEFTTAIEGIAFVGFTFDSDRELAPGKWIFTVSSKGRNIATKTFTVVKR